MTPENNPISSAVNEAVAWYLDAYPATAAAMGSTQPQHARTLGDFTAAGFESRERTGGEQLAKLDAVAGAGTGEAAFEDGIDRDLVRAQLRGQRIRDARQEWRRDPSAYLNAGFAGLYLPFQHGLQDEAGLVDDAVAKLAEVPGVLEACRENLDPGIAAALYAKRGLAQAKTGRAFLTASLPNMVQDESLRAKLAGAEETEKAAQAFDDLAVFLEDFAGTADGDWRLGEAAYSALLQDKEMLGYDAAELHERGKRAYADLDAEMREVAASIPGSGGSGDWHALMAELIKDHPPTEEAMLAEYEAETEKARQFVKDHGLMTFPDGENCRVEPGPTFLRAILSVASYNRPPALTPSRVGTFNVPFTPDGFTKEQVEDRLTTNSRVQIPTIAVHEAYPGHHWHFAWIAEQERVVRNLFTTPYFSEGWALYVETLMREQGYFTDPRFELGHLDARIMRAARIVVDTGLHCGDMTIEQAEQFMTTKVSMSAGTAAGEVNRYCAWPTQAPSYLTGSLEIEAIRGDYLAQGKGTLREFHDTIAGSGALPLGLARRVALR